MISVLILYDSHDYQQAKAVLSSTDICSHFEPRYHNDFHHRQPKILNSPAHKSIRLLGVMTYRNGPKWTYENTETDFYGYRNGPEWTSVGTEMDRNRLQLIPKWTSMGTRKGRVG